jgi:hypothetical protein
MLSSQHFKDLQLPGTVDLERFKADVAACATPAALRIVLESRTINMLETCAHLQVLERAEHHVTQDSLDAFEKSLTRQLLLQTSTPPNTLCAMTLLSRSAELAAKAKVLRVVGDVSAWGAK